MLADIYPLQLTKSLFILVKRNGENMLKDEQDSRQMMMAFLVADMQVDIAQASEIVADLEEAKLIQINSNGNVIIKELEGDS